jgi:hypothetical protein
MAKEYHQSQLDYIKGSYMPFTANALIQPGAGVLHGIIINSNTSGSFRVYDGTSGTGIPIGGTFTPTTATSSVITFPKPIEMTLGVWVATGGTIDATAVVS